MALKAFLLRCRHQFLPAIDNKIGVDSNFSILKICLKLGFKHELGKSFYFLRFLNWG